jgi:hypothetical protein
MFNIYILFITFSYTAMIDKLYYRISLLLNAIALVVVIKFYNRTDSNSFGENDISNCISEKSYSSSIQPNVQVFNVSKPLEPDAIYTEIQCKKSARFVVSTTLCYHTPLEKDAFVSGSIFREGVWEPNILSKFF